MTFVILSVPHFDRSSRRHTYQLVVHKVGVASGWNLWVWLQCVGVVLGVVVRRYIDILTIIINFPYSTCISSIFGSSIPTSLFMFFRSYSIRIGYCILVFTILL